VFVESLFRKRFFVVHLVALALLGVLLAKLVGAVASTLLVSKLGASAASPAAPPRASARASTLAPMRDFNAAAERNIFEARRDVAEAKTDKKIDDEGAWWEAPRSSLRLRLVGVTVFADPRTSLASIVDEAKGATATDTHSINECVSADISELSPEDQKLQPKPGACNKIGDVAVLKRIEPERVYIVNTSENRIEYIGLNEPPEKGGAAPSPAKPADVAKVDDGAPAAKDLGAGIVKVSDTNFKVPRSTVDEALNSLADLATQARIVPAFEGGKPVGFKLFSIKPNSLYSKIGLKNGDVINRINGYEINSPEKGLEIYGKLKDSQAITVDVKRRGKPTTLEYGIE
jgi:general secretion pathway protein C